MHFCWSPEQKQHLGNVTVEQTDVERRSSRKSKRRDERTSSHCLVLLRDGSSCSRLPFKHAAHATVRHQRHARKRTPLIWFTLSCVYICVRERRPKQRSEEDVDSHLSEVALTVACPLLNGADLVVAQIADGRKKTDSNHVSCVIFSPLCY